MAGYNFLSLPETIRKRTVLEAWLLLWACRIGLWFAPFPKVLAGVQFCANRSRVVNRLTPEQAVRAIEQALRFSWHASCLTQALAGWIMLTRHGTGCRVRIGVLSPERHGFKAHAWLETGGQVILGQDVGEPGLDSYQIIWNLPTEPRSGL